MNSLTLRKIKNIKGFTDIYKKVLLSRKLTEIELEKLLSISILLLGSESEEVFRLGYRLILIYAQITEDTSSLIKFSSALGYFPVTASLDQEWKDGNIFEVFEKAFVKSFYDGEKTLTFEQAKVTSLLNDYTSGDVSYIAPTSYGKSELMISKLKDFKEGNCCILVPTKSLIAQTKRRVLKSNVLKGRKLITHYEMYNTSDNDFVSILTQERLIRLLRENKDLSFKYLFVDEAHNLFSGDHRSTILASTILMLKRRSFNLSVLYFSPFIVNVDNLKTKYLKQDLKHHRINEYIKSEKIYFVDFREKYEKDFVIYDQFMNDFYYLDSRDSFLSPIDFVLKKSDVKNIIYLNKPTDVEKVVKELFNNLKDVNCEVIENSCVSLAEILDEDYFLINALKRGIVYHHAAMPDNVKQFVEYIYTHSSAVKYVVTTSTLLEGVNLPGRKLFLLSNGKGQGYLSAPQLKNLVGRVCRFNEIFPLRSDALRYFTPEIYFVASDNYTSKKGGLVNYIETKLREGIKIHDDCKNTLLENVKINDENRDKEKKNLEYLENLDPGISGEKNVRVLNTDVGQLLSSFNAVEFDIFDNEEKLQELIDKLVEGGNKLGTVEDVISFISTNFITLYPDIPKYYNIRRLLQEKTQKFYVSFFKWKIRGATFKQLIESMLERWKIREEKGKFFEYVGRWGDFNIKDRESDDYRNWIDKRGKNRPARVNLAIVRIKEEQDFVDYQLFKYVEVLKGLEAVELDLYNKLKYGTSNPVVINMIRSGFSPVLSKLLINRYKDFWFYNIDKTAILLKNSIVNEMRLNNENEILILEAMNSVEV